MIRVLAVDDSKLFLGMIKTILEFKGMEVATSDNPMEALQQIRDKDFDLLITDMNMPFMDSIKLAGMVRKIAPGLPIIIFSSMPALESGRLVREAGIEVAAVMEKCVSINELVQTVGNIIAGKNINDKIETCRTQKQSFS